MTCRAIIDDIGRAEWEQYVKDFADYSIYQTWPYQQVRSEADGQQLVRVAIRDDDGSIATMFQMRIKVVRPLALKIGYVQRGPLVRRKDGRLSGTVEAMKAVREICMDGRVNVLRLVPNVFNDQAGSRLDRVLSAGGFTRVKACVSYRTFVCRVDDSEEQIRKRLHKSFRRDLKRAEEAGIDVRQGSDTGYCDILRELYGLSVRRKGFRALDAEQFISCQHDLMPCGKMNIFVAYFESEPVSALLSSNLGDTAVVLLAASNERGLACGASYLLWYRGAVSAMKSGMKLYDLGGIDPVGNPGVYRFKSRMGGQEQSHIGAYEACLDVTRKVVWRVSERIYNLFKK